jgi:hypothetical protein
MITVTPWEQLQILQAITHLFSKLMALLLRMQFQFADIYIMSQLHFYQSK